MEEVVVVVAVAAYRHQRHFPLELFLGFAHERGHVQLLHRDLRPPPRRPVDRAERAGAQPLAATDDAGRLRQLLRARAGLAREASNGRTLRHHDFLFF